MTLNMNDGASQIIWLALRFARRRSLRFVEICEDVLGFVRLCKDLLGCGKTC